MPFALAQTATNYLDLLDKIVVFITSRSATAAPVAAAGSLYVVGEVLTLTGGTSTITTTLTVTEESAISSAITAAGTGYTVGDDLTVVGGTFTTAATFNVDTVGGSGEVTAISLIQGGAYTVTPSSPAATTVVPSGGTGCTLTPTYGGVATVRISQSGAYTSIPGNPVSTTASASGTGATFTMTFNTDNGWTVKRRTKEAVSAVVAAGGTGHVIGDDLTVTGGVEVDTAPLFNIDSVGALSAVVAVGGTGYTNGSTDVLTVVGGTGTASTWTATVSGGIVTSVALLTAGDYTVLPGNPAATTVVPSGGTGCTLTVTYGVAVTFSLVTAGKLAETPANPASTTSSGSGTAATLTVTYQNHTSTDWDLLIEGEGGGADMIFAGIRTFTQATARQFELRGMTGYTAANNWDAQPGISPGSHEAAAAIDRQGCYTPLNNSSMTYWLFVSGRRILGIFKVGASTYTSMYLGWMNPFGTASDFPYPFVVGGCSSERSRLFSSTDSGYSGMLDPISDDSHNAAGPMEYRDPAGVWNQIHNSQGAGSGRNAQDDFVCWPAGSLGTTGMSADDITNAAIHITTELIPNSGSPGTATKFMKQTPETPDEISLLWPTMLVREGDGGSIPRDVHGELEGVFWTSADMDGAAAVAASEDTLTDPDTGTRYHFFQNCNRTELFSNFVVKEV